MAVALAQKPESRKITTGPSGAAESAATFPGTQYIMHHTWFLAVLVVRLLRLVLGLGPGSRGVRGRPSSDSNFFTNAASPSSQQRQVCLIIVVPEERLHPPVATLRHAWHAIACGEGG